MRTCRCWIPYPPREASLEIVEREKALLWLMRLKRGWEVSVLYIFKHVALITGKVHVLTRSLLYMCVHACVFLFNRERAFLEKVNNVSQEFPFYYLSVSFLTSRLLNLKSILQSDVCIFFIGNQNKSFFRWKKLECSTLTAIGDCYLKLKILYVLFLHINCKIHVLIKFANQSWWLRNLTFSQFILQGKKQLRGDKYP